MKFARHIPFVELLGAELLRFDDGESELALNLRDELCNSWPRARRPGPARSLTGAA